MKKHTESPTKVLLQELAALASQATRPSEQPQLRADEIAEPAGVYEFGPEVPPHLPDCDQLAVSVWQRLRKLEAAYSARGRSFTDLGSLETLCERMVAAIPAPSLWDDLLGPFYSPGQIAKLLGGISRQAVADRRSRGTLLGLKTADNVWVYPTFQLGADNEILPGLPAVLQILIKSKVDDWTLAGWLVSPLETLGGSSPIQWLARGEDLEILLVLSRDAALRFDQ